MAESRPITIRFPQRLFAAIKQCADARGKSFGEVVVETCEERYTKHEPTIADRVKVLEEKVNKLEDK
tara:strand:- start:1058 stop:1258 length:201 start_codon:yes stop_codon:yes gene_type:complete